VNQSSHHPLAAGPITNHDEITVVLIEPIDGTPTARSRALAATSHDSSRHLLPCCGGGHRAHHRRVRYSSGTIQGGRIMNNDLKAFVLSVGGLLAVGGSALLMLWAVLS
jgi:hypothetical protein